MTNKLNLNNHEICKNGPIVFQIFLKKLKNLKFSGQKTAINDHKIRTNSQVNPKFELVMYIYFSIDFQKISENS